MQRNFLWALLLLALVIFNFLLSIIQWIPSTLVMSIVYIVSVLSYILIAIVGYKLISIFLQQYIKIKVVKFFVSVAFLVLYVCLVLFQTFMYSGVFLPIHMETKRFKDKTFYAYDIGFLESMVETRMQDEHIPFVARTLHISQKIGAFSLEQFGYIVYVVFRSESTGLIKEKIPIYDLEQHKDFCENYALDDMVIK